MKVRELKRENTRRGQRILYDAEEGSWSEGKLFLNPFSKSMPAAEQGSFTKVELIQP